MAAAIGPSLEDFGQTVVGVPLGVNCRSFLEPYRGRISEFGEGEVVNMVPLLFIFHNLFLLHKFVPQYHGLLYISVQP